MNVRDLPTLARLAYRGAQLLGFVGIILALAGIAAVEAIARRYRRDPEPQPNGVSPEIERARWEAKCREAGWDGKRVDA